jgi:hypothetical protein
MSVQVRFCALRWGLEDVNMRTRDICGAKRKHPRKGTAERVLQLGLIVHRRRLMPRRNHFWQRMLQQSDSALFGNFFGCDDAVTLVIMASSRKIQAKGHQPRAAGSSPQHSAIH